MALRLTLSDIRKNLDPRFVGRGRDYFRRGNVLDCHLSSGGLRIRGRVAGTLPRPYSVEIDLDRFDDEIDIDGECTCPIGYNCKHVAALLFAALEEQRSAPADKPSGQQAVDGWLKQLNSALAARRTALDTLERYPANVRKRLLYLLDLNTHGNNRVLHLTLLSAYQLKSGRFGNATPYQPENLASHGPASHILPSDQVILRRLYTISRIDAIPWNQLRGPDSAQLLREMLATGRCRWQDRNGPLLTEGEPRPARPAWTHPDDYGRQRPVLQIEPSASEILPLNPPWYLDLERGECGPLESGLVPALLEAWRRAPAVAPDDVEVVGNRLAALSAELPLPRAIPVRESATAEPSPVATLTGLRSQPPRDPYWFEEIGAAASPEPALLLQFDYGGSLLPPAGREEENLDRFTEGVLLRLRRDLAAESRAAARLAEAGLTASRELDLDGFAFEEYPPGSFVVDEMRREVRETWIDFMLQTVEELRRAGWRIEIEESFPYRLAEISAWHMDLDDRPDNHWFDLDLGIDVDGERMSLLPILLQAFDRIPPEQRAELREAPEDHQLLFPLDDGRILPLPTRRIAHILDALVELFDRQSLTDDGRLRLSEWRAAELSELGREEPELQWSGNERLASLAERLRRFEKVRAASAPRGFRARLRPYQKEGLGWLQFLRAYDLHGILADDMGLGKTVQTLAHILREKREGRLDRPALVVAPTSLMHNWRQETAQFAPELSVLTLHGPDRSQHYERIADHDLVLTTYPLLPRDEEILLERQFHLLILDEAQQIKNPKAKAAQVARRLDARHRLCLTGTPLENHLGELWSLFHFLMPGLLGDQSQFRRLFRTPIEKHGDDERALQLARRVAPFMLRRTKEEVASDLPPKTEIVRSVPLEGTQRDLYESIRLAMHEKVRSAIASQGLNRSHIVILDALLKLRQVCCDPRLLKIQAARRVKRSAKFELLMELLPELLQEGRRILLFSQFTTMLGLIEEALQKEGISYLKLTGQTRDRATPIDRFQKGEVPLFLISLKAGGTGLNLTAADTVIHYDPWWNPAVENQATDRTHRIGQQKPVFVYKLLTEGTVEERIQAMQARKQRLADDLFAGGGRGRLPGAEEISALFEPLA